MNGKNNNAEIVACTYKRTNNENITTLLSDNLIMGSGIEMLEFAFEQEVWFAWGKLIKTEIAKKCPFTKGLIYEDVENTPKIFLLANKVVFSLDGRYNYRVRNDSIMGENKTIPKADIAKVIDMDCEFISNASISNLDKEKMFQYLFKQLAYNYNFLWKKSGCISYSRKLAYWLLSEHPGIYKIWYRLYSTRRQKDNE